MSTTGTAVAKGRSIMKRMLFSAGFIAASAVYVVAVHHFVREQPAPGADIAAAEPMPENEQTFVSTPSATVAAKPTTKPQTIVSQLPVARAPLPSADIAEPFADPVKPPLPRIRPTPPRAPSSAVAAARLVRKASGFVDGTYVGTQEDAYYGQVKVQITISAHQVVAVKVLDYPQDRRTSRSINSRALPILRQEAVAAATTANIDVVSGATLTSGAYIQSLRSALRQAGGNG